MLLLTRAPLLPLAAAFAAGVAAASYAPVPAVEALGAATGLLCAATLAA